MAYILFVSDEKKINVNKYGKVSAAVRRELEHRFKFDIKFYNFLKKRFYKQKQIYLS